MTTEIVKRHEVINLNGARLEHYKYTMVWGTYGKGGVEHCFGTCSEHQLRWMRLIDCSSEHLIAILRTQPQITSLHRVVINNILNDRKFAMGLIEESAGFLA